MMIRFSLLLLALVALAMPSRLLACTCLAPGTEQEAIDQSAAVFAGRVIQVRTVLDAGVPYLEATFLVHRWWKGEGGRTVAIRTPHSSCGLPLQVGSYRIFAAPFRGHLTTGTCSAPRAAQPPVALRTTRERGCAG